MIPLHSMMSANALPALMKTFGVVVLLLSFALGFVKGFRRVSWGGLTWAVAGGTFVLIGRALPPDNKINFIVILLLAMAVIVATCALFGTLGHYLRPKMRWVKDDVNGDTSLAEFGLEFEPEYLDYDGEHEYAPYGKRLHKTGFGPPCFFFRVLGGLTCVINSAIVLWLAYSLFILTINATDLAQGSLGVLIQGKWPELLLEFAKQCTFEIIAIGIMMVVAMKGYKKGMIASIHALVVSFGGVLAFGISFYLPFSAQSSATSGFFKPLGTLVTRCTNVFVNFEKVSRFSGVLGRLTAGVCLFCLALLILWLIDLVFKKCSKIIHSTAPTRVLDSCVAFILYLIIGALICTAILFVLATADYFGIFYVSKALSEGAHLTDGLIDFVQVMLDGLMAPYMF